MEPQSESVKLSAAPGGVAEGELIGESVWGAIQALRERGLAKKVVARELGLDVKTVRKWWRRSWRPQVRSRRVRELDRFEGFLGVRAPEVGFNAVVLDRELRGMGYRGSYSTLLKYLAPLRPRWRPEEQPTVRFETGPGEQGQVDWGTTWVYLGAERVRVHVFTMVLGFSRRIFARAYPSEGLGSLLDAHAAAFVHFGGRPRRLLYDNPRTIVTDKDEATGRVVWNATFKDRMDFYGVEIQLCRYYRAQTKGKVESGVKYVKRNALAGRRLRDLEDLNAWLEFWCVEIADRRLHGTTHERPAERFARAEREALVAVDRRPPAPRERVESRVVPRDGYVAVEANRYPVPLEWAGRTVEVRIHCDEIWLRWEAAEPVRHVRLSGKHQVARWEGPPRQCPRRAAGPAAGPPRFDPYDLGPVGEVEIRPLGCYETTGAEVAS